MKDITVCLLVSVPFACTLGRKFPILLTNQKIQSCCCWCCAFRGENKKHRQCADKGRLCIRYVQV